MMSSAFIDQLLSTLQVYGQTYGWPTEVDQQRALVGTLLRLTQGAKNAPLSLGESAQIIDQVIEQFDLSKMGGAIANQAQQRLVNQAHQWQAELQQKATDTLAAYVQAYAPGLDPTALRDLATRVIPIVADQEITPAEAKGLVGQVIQAFDLEAALGQSVNPAVISGVKALVTSLSQKPLETAVSETITAYINQFVPDLEEIGEDLIEQAINAVLKNQVDFGFDTDLELLDGQLLINQISFTLNLMKQSPPPSKTAQQLAAELGTEIQRLRQKRQETLGSGDVTQGLASQDGLSISSGWTSTRRPKASDPPTS